MQNSSRWETSFDRWMKHEGVGKARGSLYSIFLEAAKRKISECGVCACVFGSNSTRRRKANAGKKEGKSVCVFVYNFLYKKKEAKSYDQNRHTQLLLRFLTDEQTEPIEPRG